MRRHNLTIWANVGGGVGCAGCHAAPEFDIAPDSGNNGIIGILNGTGIDVTNTRAPSLRDIVKRDGTLNTPLMHRCHYFSGYFTRTLQRHQPRSGQRKPRPAITPQRFRAAVATHRPGNRCIDCLP
jgi:hypothetical protein